MFRANYCESLDISAEFVSHYVGCYKDLRDRRALNESQAAFQDNSIERCTTHCHTKG